MERNTVLLDLKDYEDLKTKLKRTQKELSEVLHDKTIRITTNSCWGVNSRFYSKTESVEQLIKQRDNNLEQIRRFEKEVKELTDGKWKAEAELQTIRNIWWYKLFK